MSLRIFTPFSGFNPKNISNLTAWWDASNFNTLSLGAGNVVNTWNDISGNNQMATGNNNPGGLPVYSSTGFNGKPTIEETTATNQFMGTTISSLTTPTVFVVGQLFAGNPSQPSWIGGGGGAYCGAGGSYFQIDDSDNNYCVAPTGSLLALNTPYLFVFNFESSPSTATITYNGTNVTLTSGGASWSTLNGPTIGAHDLNGSYSEIIIYDRSLTSTETNKVSNYLRTKWGF